MPELNFKKQHKNRKMRKPPNKKENHQITMRLGFNGSEKSIVCFYHVIGKEDFQYAQLVQVGALQ